MRILDARARAEELKDLNLFIAMTTEDGDGEVVAVKDLVDVRGTPTTGGGRLLPTEPKSEDAPLIRNLRNHGCVMIGKTNLHEWAFGSTNMNRHYGTVHNPRDRSRVAVATSSASDPIVSSEKLSGTTPFVSMVPKVGLNPTIPHSAAGMRTDPSVSLPIAQSHAPAATAAAEPPDEPPATRDRSRGLCTVP